MRKKRMTRAVAPAGILCALLLLLPFSLPAQEIASVSPTTVAPGDSVTVTGGPFSPQTRIELGGRTIEPAAATEGRMSFVVPPLDAGAYRLRILEGGVRSAQSFLLRIAAPAPRIDALTPSNIDLCSLPEERQVTVQGHYFASGARLLLDGRVLASTRQGSGSMSFTAPPLAAGVYGIQVVNPEGAESIPYSLYVNDLPEIRNVYIGEEFVNYYHLVIEGKNFFFNSTVLVDEYPVGFFDLPPQQRVIQQQSATSDSDKLASPAQSDNIRFVDCGTLVYNRFPYSTQPKSISLQVINPDGKTSSSWQLTAP